MRGGAVGLRGRHARCPRVAPLRRRGSGRLLVDEPAPGVARLTISNPAKRGALDHAILDSFTSLMGTLDARCVMITGEQTIVLGRLRHRRAADLGVRRRGREARRAPVRRGDRRDRGLPVPDARRPQRAHDRRRARAGARLRPADRGGHDRAGDAAGQARPGLLAHRHPQVHRHDRGRRAHASCSSSAGGSTRAPPARGDSSTPSPRTAASRRRRSSWRPRSPPTRRSPRPATSASSAPCSTLRLELDPETERELIELRAASFASEDFREGVRAFAEKRPPRWQGK